MVMMIGQKTVHGVEMSLNREMKKSRGEEETGINIVFSLPDTHIRLKSL